MPLVICRECQATVSSIARQCPNCGAPMNAPYFRGVMGCISLLVLTPVVGAYIFVPVVQTQVNGWLDTLLQVVRNLT